MIRRAKIPGSARTHPTTRVAFTVVTLLLSAVTIRSAEPTDYSAVDAIFTEYCLDCHGSTEPEAKLIMESHELLMKGGESGAVVVPGKSDESLLVKLIEGRVEKDGKKLIMPPGKKREKLKPEQIALIRAWIDAGAKPPAEVKIRELITPRIEPKTSPRKAVNAIAYLPAHKLIALARYGEVELRSAATRAVVRTLKGHRGNVNAVTFSPDGKFLFAAGGEAGWFGETRQWDLHDGNLFYVFEGHRDAIYSLAVSPEKQAVECRDRRGNQNPFRPQRRGVRSGFPSRRKDSRQRQRRSHGETLGRGDGRTARHAFPAAQGAIRRRVQSRRHSARRGRRGQSNPCLANQRDRGGNYQSDPRIPFRARRRHS